MFFVQLRFSDNKSKARELMDARNAWIRRGFDDGIFLMAGSLVPNAGGGIVAHNTSRPDLQDRINDDPFVAQNVVSAEIVEFSPARADERLQFLLG
jgi:uncharacterized protein YciI